MTVRGDDLTFLCLDPRKGKRGLIAAVLNSIGSVRWQRLPPLSVRSFPETRARATDALDAGTTRP
jgi:capsular polysaccharide export protein